MNRFLADFEQSQILQVSKALYSTLLRTSASIVLTPPKSFCLHLPVLCFHVATAAGRRQSIKDTCKSILDTEKPATGNKNQEFQCGFAMAPIHLLDLIAIIFSHEPRVVLRISWRSYFTLL
jgi:hypothetical protein